MAFYDRKLRPEDEEGLEERGIEAVRILLISAAPDPETRVEGLYGPEGRYIIRRDAELWLRRKDAERKAEAKRFNRIMLVLGIIAAAGAIMAAWEGRATLFGG